MTSHQNPQPTYRYQTSGRNTRTVAVLACFWLGLGIAWLWLQAAWWILLPLVLFSLPAIWDLWSDRQSGLTLDQRRLSWFSGKRSGEVFCTEIVKVRFDTRLDFSVRVTLHLRDGAKVRLPYDSLPPHRELEDAMTAVGLSTERRHFALL